MPSDTTVPMRLRIPRTVWTLGLISLFMDLSSELIHALLPIFMVTTLGLSVTALGLIEGIAEATALIVKVFSGAISDWMGRRKGLLLLGYGLAALTKPLFPLAGEPATAIAARLLDRVGKGIRGAPRDAMVADVAQPEIRGACFGLRQSMDTVGAVLGPLLAIGLMYAFAERIRTVMWFAVAPAFIAVALIVFVLDETNRAAGTRAFRSPLPWRALREFPGRYGLVVAIGAIFTLARFSEAFLVVRAQQTGLSLTWIPAVMVVMSAAYTASAYPAGKLSDVMDRRVPLMMGLVALIGADLLLGLGQSLATLMLGVALWGLHMGFTQGIFAAMVADSAPAARRGAAFGVFNLASGVCMIAGSALAGWLWDRAGSTATFLAGAALTVVALALCWLAPPRHAQDIDKA